MLLKMYNDIILNDTLKNKEKEINIVNNELNKTQKENNAFSFWANFLRKDCLSNLSFRENQASTKFQLCCYATVILGLLAHAFVFFNANYNADENCTVTTFFDNDWQISIGRYWQPLYRALIHDNFSAPWLIGAAALLYIAVAVYLITEMLNISSKVFIVAISGILATNLTVTLVMASFINWADIFMFAMLLNVFAVYLWSKHKNGFLLGSLAIAVALGLYQAYISVAICLVLMVLMLQLWNHSDVGAVFLNGIKSVGMLLIGGVIYAIGIKISCAITGVTLVSSDVNYNAISGVGNFDGVSIPDLLKRTWSGCFGFLFESTNEYNTSFIKIFTVVLLLAIGVFCLLAVIKRFSTWKERGLFLLLLAFLPLGANVVFFISKGVIHELMYYAYFFIYIFAVLAITLVITYLKEHGKTRGPAVMLLATSTILFAIIFNNIQFANVMYQKKDLEFKSTFSFMTRVVDRIEQMEEYEPGVTPVAFLTGKNYGIKQLKPLLFFDEYSTYFGTEEPTSITYFSTYWGYFQYVLNTPIWFAEQEYLDALYQNEYVKQMAVFPAKDSVQYVDGILVVKLDDF